MRLPCGRSDQPTDDEIAVAFELHRFSYRVAGTKELLGCRVREQELVGGVEDRSRIAVLQCKTEHVEEGRLHMQAHQVYGFASVHGLRSDLSEPRGGRDAGHFALEHVGKGSRRSSPGVHVAVEPYSV